MPKRATSLKAISLEGRIASKEQMLGSRSTHKSLKLTLFYTDNRLHDSTRS